MPTNKKQLLRMVRLIALLWANKYPNCTSFCKMLQDADIYEKMLTFFWREYLMSQNVHTGSIWNGS